MRRARVDWRKRGWCCSSGWCERGWRERGCWRKCGIVVVAGIVAAGVAAGAGGAAAVGKDGQLCDAYAVVGPVSIVARAPQIVVDGAILGGDFNSVAVAAWVKVAALLNRDKRAVVVWAQAPESERRCVLHVVVVHHVAVAVRGDAVVPAARIELWQGLLVGVLLLAVERGAVGGLPYLVRVRAGGAVQTLQPFVEVVACMPTALVEKRDVLAVLVPREGNAALVRDHLLRSLGVDPAGDVPVVAVGASESLQDAVLLRVEAGFERAED